MLQRVGGYLTVRSKDAPSASNQLEDQGFAVLPGVFGGDELTRLRIELEAVYASSGGDGRSKVRDPQEDNDFRYACFNRSAAALEAISNRTILDVIEPLLGEDCHVIANTCWRNPPREQATHGGGGWHIDAGPHIPRDPSVPWDERIPYPVFAIGAHIYLEPCDLESGPTGVLAGSHKSGQHPPTDRYMDESLTYNEQGAVPLLAEAGDVALFVSDVWHRRLPTKPGDRGRFFLQVHYGRRDMAQRVLTTEQVNHVADVPWIEAASKRQRSLLGLHPPFFYDG